MKKIEIDLETYSSADLNKCGVYRYCEAVDFEVLLFGYSVDGGEVRVIDLSRGEKIPAEIVRALTDEAVEKWAHNVQFERVCLSRFLRDMGLLGEGEYLSPRGWYCSMIWSAYLGLPFSLAAVGAALGLEEQKMTEGKNLIRFFCVPCKPTKANNQRTRNRPEDNAEKWNTFIKYNKRDVEVEMRICEKLRKFPVPYSIWNEFWLDQEINDRGILVDKILVDSAIQLDNWSQERLKAALQDLTNLDNPNSVAQMKEWLSENGMEMNSLGKKDVAEAVKTAPEPLRTVLLLRQQSAKSAVKKYVAMDNAVCADGRCRGMFQFYGANRSGRFAGRIVQLQNLYRNSLVDLDEARALVKQNNKKALEVLYDSVPEVLAELVRTAFVPEKGKKFIVADFSAIEARVLSYMAGEQWRLDVFKNGGDIYCATAEKMYGVKVVKHGENGELRQKGKQAELACIAEGSVVLTGRGEVKIENVIKGDMVWDGERWVKCGGAIFRGWKAVYDYDGLQATADHLVFVEGQDEPMMFAEAIINGMRLRKINRAGFSPHYYRIGYKPVYDILNAGSRHRFVVSGCLVHNCGYGGGVGALKAMGALEAGIEEEELDGIVKAWRKASPKIVKMWWDVDREIKKAIKEKTTTHTHNLTFSYQSGFLFITLPSGRKLAYVKPRIGENQFGGESVTYMGVNKGKWERIESYGPKFVENLIQGISRDILVYAMETLREYRIVATVHDEVILECDMDENVEDICELMGRTPPWMEGLELRADGYECMWYRPCVYREAGNRGKLQGNRDGL